MSKKEKPAQVEVNWWRLILLVVGFIVAVIVMVYLFKRFT